MEQDIESLKKELERLRGLVFYDPLTRIFNRLGFQEEAEKALKAVSFGRSAIERRIGFQIPSKKAWKKSSIKPIKPCTKPRDKEKTEFLLWPKEIENFSFSR